MIIRGSKFLLRIKRNKYGNKKTVVDENVFSSRCEAGLFNLLKSMEKKGEIRDVELQPKVYLTKANILFKPDFKAKCTTSNQGIWFEGKGKETAPYRIKRRLWKFYGPGILRVYKCKGIVPYLYEEIIPTAE